MKPLMISADPMANAETIAIGIRESRSGFLASGCACALVGIMYQRVAPPATKTQTPDKTETTLDIRLNQARQARHLYCAI